MAVYYIELLEKWPKIGRFSTLVNDRESCTIMIVSWSCLIIVFLFSLAVMGYYFFSLGVAITDWSSFLFYVLCVISFMLIPKCTAGLVVGITAALLPHYFWREVRSAYRRDRTTEEIYLSREHVMRHKLRDSPKRCKSYGMHKTVGNFLFMLTFLSIPALGGGSYPRELWFVPIIFFITALALPWLQKKREG